MRWLTKYLSAGTKRGSQSSLATRAVPEEHYEIQRLFGGKIERALSGHGAPLLVRVPQLDLISDLQEVSQSVETVYPMEPEHRGVTDMERALALASGAPISLGRSQEQVARGLRRAQAARSNKKNAA